MAVDKALLTICIYRINKLQNYEELEMLYFAICLEVLELSDGGGREAQSHGRRS